MTKRVGELRALGVHPMLLLWRQWRRCMHLSIPEAAAMAGVSADWLGHAELGSPRARLRPDKLARLEALMARWKGHTP